jgi:aromatic-L-amino-acid/L-tryptophan decarboxylase
LPDDPEAVRHELTAAAQWAAGYLETIRSHPVAPHVRPGDIEAALPAGPPTRPEDLETILDDVGRILVPGILHWNHPRFFGYFGITGSTPGVAGELVAAALNVNAMLWKTSPAATELEGVATRWLASMLGLPQWFAMITDTASSATFSALAAARHRAAPQARMSGLAGGPLLALYASDQAHSSVDKAVIALGLGLDHLRRVPSDEAFRMDPVALEEAMARDAAAGIVPMAVVATVGTTAATAVDPVPSIAAACRRHGAWLHVDAAYGGAAGAVPELRWVLDGVGRADSLVVNPHKWLFVPVDCSVLYVKDPEVMREALSVVPDYLRSDEPVRNLMDYGIALGRRFRALKLWMVLRAMGTEAIAAAIRGHVRLAGLLAGWVEQEAGFSLAAPVPLSVVNLRHVPEAGMAPEAQDAVNARLAEAVNATGEAFVTTARIGGRLAVHAAIGNLGTTEDDVRALWDTIRRCAAG